MGETTSTRLTKARLTKAEAKREFSAGGVVFKRPEAQNPKSEILWLVTRTAPSKLYPKTWWRLPKGWIDNKKENIPGPIASGVRKATEEQLRKAALREVKEEGGVTGKVVSKVGTIKIFLNLKGEKILKFATFYLIEWQKDLSEGFGFETSDAAWLPFEDAYGRLKHKSEKETLKKAKKILDQGIPSQS